MIKSKAYTYIAVLLAALCAAGCSSSEQELSEKLIGSWYFSQEKSDGVTTMTIEGDGEYFDDDTSEGSIAYTVSGMGVSAALTIETVSDWKIQGKHLIEKPVSIEIVAEKGNPLVLKNIKAEIKKLRNKETRGLIKHIDDEEARIYHKTEKVTMTLHRYEDEE
ncbi:hypothetical protein ACFL43_04680 [Thermodesulfobacteriota bacterium]